MKKDFITISLKKNVHRKIFTNDIIFCKAERVYCTIKTHNEELLHTKPLKQLEALLKGRDNFVKINRSYIVNINNCIELNNSNKPELKLINSKALTPNRDCLQQIEKLFKIVDSEM